MDDLLKLKPIDLTLPLRTGMRGYHYDTVNTVANHGWNARLLHIYSHAGTHMDAPLHFEATEETIDQYPVSRFFGKAWLAKVPLNKPGQLIEVDHLGEVKEHFQPGESLLLETQWSQYVGESKYRDEMPRISVGLANWCVENKVNMLGVEPPSVADVNNMEELTQIHQILLKGRVIIIEGLTNLGAITGNQVILVALPLKITGGDGAPARVIAFE
ncbi:MAG: cyclase [Cyclobacteriaceae bacterium]|nr:MAG: cyclase [Cyclobacteriaceae bacterium]